MGRQGVVCGGAACEVELWPGFCGGVAARGAWRVGGYGWCGSAATVARWRLLCGFGEVLECVAELWPGFDGGWGTRHNGGGGAP